MQELVMTVNVWLQGHGVWDCRGFWYAVYLFAMIAAFFLIGWWRSE